MPALWTKALSGLPDLLLCCLCGAVMPDLVDWQVAEVRQVVLC